MSERSEALVADAREHGNALLKFISANDVGLTGGHQCGFYLPEKQRATEFYASRRFEPGSNFEEEVEVDWYRWGRTQSCVKWYGTRTRSEFRLTRFGRDFPFRTEADLGNVLALVRTAPRTFRAYVLDTEEEIEYACAALGVEFVGTYALYPARAVMDVNACLKEQFAEFAASCAGYPSGAAFTRATVEALSRCDPAFSRCGVDARLLRGVTVEYQLYRTVEASIDGPSVREGFQTVDAFVEKANEVLNRRKSRAGRSLENHVEQVLSAADLPHVVRPAGVPGTPDFLFPAAEAYHSSAYPESGLLVLGVKTTCKDRWRQVTQEAPRVRTKHLLTLQPGISEPQVREMTAAGVRLVVPDGLQREYPPSVRGRLVSLEAFLAHCRATLASVP